MKISVVAPLYRSAPYIVELHRRAVIAVAETGADTYEIILINDGSPDDSLEIAKRVASRDPNVVVVDLSRNFGQHRATMTGLAQSTGDYVFVLDSDLEDEPEWLSEFFRQLTTHKCDVVYGINNNLKGGWLYTQARGLFYQVLNTLSSIPLPPNVCSARLMSRRYVNALLQFPERELFMAGIWHMAGFSQLPLEVVKQSTSPSTYSTGKLVNVFINAVTAFSTRPLEFISIVGLTLSTVAFCFTGWVLYQKIVFGVAIEGWASVMAAVLLIGGISLFFNGIMAIYIAKIFLEVKQRPRSIIKEIHRAKESGDGPNGKLKIDASM